MDRRAPMCTDVHRRPGRAAPSGCASREGATDSSLTARRTREGPGGAARSCRDMSRAWRAGWLCDRGQPAAPSAGAAPHGSPCPTPSPPAPPRRPQPSGRFSAPGAGRARPSGAAGPGPCGGGAQRGGVRAVPPGTAPARDPSGLRTVEPFPLACARRRHRSFCIALRGGSSRVPITGWLGCRHHPAMSCSGADPCDNRCSGDHCSTVKSMFYIRIAQNLIFSCQKY